MYYRVRLRTPRRTFSCLAACFALAQWPHTAIAACSADGGPSTPVTATDEATSFPGSRQLVNGTGTVVDTSTAGQIKINVSGGGTVSSFSSGNLSPLFTTSVSNPTTTPALNFSLSNSGAYTVFGNNTNASAAPDFQNLVNQQLPQRAVVMGATAERQDLGRFRPPAHRSP
jgi:hypothetical protein